MRLSNEVYEYIQQEAVDIFTRYDVKCTPINGYEIAQKMGIVLIPFSALEHEKQCLAERISKDGFYLEPGNGKEYIYYNDVMGYERSNMTILHEIGHCVLGHTSKTDPEQAEAEANFFAKYAIAPPPLVHIFRPKRPEDIQKYFCISYEAANNALAYYYKWLMHGKVKYTKYERELLQLFKFAC